MRRYRTRISGPLLDRIDIKLSLQREPLNLSSARDSSGEDSAAVRRRVQAAVGRQVKRCGTRSAGLCDDQLRRWCRPDRAGRRILQRAAERFAMSLRACDRTLRVARTISDLDGCDEINARHISEALTYQGVEKS